MSKCLILVKYSIEENQLCEESERNIGSVDISDIITTLEKNQKTFNSYGYIPILPSVLHYIDDLYEVIKSESKIGNRRHFARTTHNTFYKDAQ